MDKSIVPVNQLAVRSSTCYEFSNPNGAEVVEIEDEDTSVVTVEKQIENLKLNYRFNEKNVPQIFRTLVEKRLNSLKKIRFDIHDQFCSMKFDEIEILLKKSGNDWRITYKNETIRCDDPEKSIVDHLWFVLRNPDLKLEGLGIFSRKDSKTEDRRKLDSEKLSTLLQSMFNSINHQFHTNVLDCEKFNEDTFLSMLKHVKPGTLSEIKFDISWKKEGNFQKMEEIVKTDQWKQAKAIFSFGFPPLRIEDLLNCESFWLEVDIVTPEDVQRVVEHASNSSCTKYCNLYSKNEQLDIEAFIDFLRSQTDGSRITKINPTPPQFKYAYAIVKFDKRVVLVGDENRILISNT